MISVASHSANGGALWLLGGLLTFFILEKLLSSIPSTDPKTALANSNENNNNNENEKQSKLHVSIVVFLSYTKIEILYLLRYHVGVTNCCIIDYVNDIKKLLQLFFLVQPERKFILFICSGSIYKDYSINPLAICTF